MSSLWVFVLLWGVWLITPILIDGVEAIARLLIIAFSRPSDEEEVRLEDDELPTVSVIVPAHNEEAVIDRCINSIKAQDYPHDKLDVIVVDDGSTDNTAGRVAEHVNGNGSPTAAHDSYNNGTYFLRGEPIQVGAFHGTLTLIKNGHQGKAHALNAGIKASRGDIIVNIDSDVIMAPDSVRAIATEFRMNPELGAATGNVEIDLDIIEERDSEGRLVLDEDGDIVQKELTAGERFLAKCQFLEYLSSFWIGRESQAATGTLYTLAGACSAFRREVLDNGCMYSNQTVSEDTDLTFRLHRYDEKVGFIKRARVYLEPVVDWDGLYSQRVRWARGQMEVCGLNRDIVGRHDHGLFGWFALRQLLIYDHTLAFPRLIWAPLILFFPFIGYSWALLIQAIIAMYVLYILVEGINTLVCYSLVHDDDTRTRIENSGWLMLFLPVYRFIVFHFRFSGFLVTLREEQQWAKPGPVGGVRGDIKRLRLRSIQFASSFLAIAGAAYAGVRHVAQGLIPLLAGIATGLRIFDNLRRPG